MDSQKQSLPSFTSIISVLTIVFYYAGFLRVELALTEQKKKKNALENNEENKPPDVPNRDKLTTNTHSNFFLPKKYHTECLSYIFFNRKSCESRKFVYKYLVFACSWRRGKKNPKVNRSSYVFFAGKEYQKNNNRSLNDLCFSKVGELSYCALYLCSNQKRIFLRESWSTCRFRVLPRSSIWYQNLSDAVSVIII